MVSTSPRDAYRAFTTSCAFITTDGSKGPNVMAAEWTFNVSYHPFLILVAVDPANRSHDMILEAKEFGVNLVSDDQVAAMGFAGHYSKADTDKLSSEVFQVYPAKRIKAPMLRGCLLNAECRLLEHYRMGDHTAFLGEVLEYSVDPERNPLILHHGSHRIGERIVRGEGVVVSATPMSASAGTRVHVTGELTVVERAGREVELILSDPEGGRLAGARAMTDEEGSFHAELEIPASVPGGPYAVIARTGSVEGRARLQVAG